MCKYVSLFKGFDLFIVLMPKVAGFYHPDYIEAYQFYFAKNVDTEQNQLYIFR